MISICIQDGSMDQGRVLRGVLLSPRGSTACVDKDQLMLIKVLESQMNSAAVQSNGDDVVLSLELF